MNDNYRVVKIIDDKSIVINAGEINEIKIGDKFQIYSVGKEVIDPETKESLGTLNTVKEIVTVVDVFEKMSICKKRKYTTRNALNGFIGALNYQEVTDSQLDVNISQISGGISDNLTIEVGDKARFLKYESPKSN